MCRYAHSRARSFGRLSVFVIHLTYVHGLGLVLHVTKTLLRTYTMQSRIPRYFFLLSSQAFFCIFFICHCRRTTYSVLYHSIFFSVPPTNER